MCMVEDRKRHIASYRASNERAFWELGTSLLVWTIFIVGYGQIINRGIFYIFFPFILMRIFMIFHDAGHGSFFPSKKWNDTLMQALSVIVMTPTNWAGEHRLHHAHGGNMENKYNYQWNQTVFLTKQQIENIRPAVFRNLYTFIRQNPLIFFPLVAFYEYFIRFRMPPLDKTQPFTFKNNLQNTVSIMCLWGLLYQLKLLVNGNGTSDSTQPAIFVLDYIGTAYIAGMYGYFIFHSHHAFECSYVAEKAIDWNFTDAAFKGSALIDFPWFLQWFMMGIGYHHIHHYDPKVPGYLMEQCHDEGKSVFWSDVHVLDFFETGSFWKALTLSTYDMKSHSYQ